MLDPLNPLNEINPFSRAVVHLTMYFKAESTIQELATGTGFIYRIDHRYVLVTARHNLTGRYPDANQTISKTGGVPNEVFIEGYYYRATIPLYAGANDPNDPHDCPAVFRQHPSDPTMDIAVLPFTSPNEWATLDASFFSERQYIKLAVTQTCFVVGYPYGLVDRPDPYHVLPIYKTANIASEPYIDFQGKPIVVIDVTTRPGMSGSPVIVQEPHFGMTRNRLLGIYTGRFPGLKEGDDSALGIVYNRRAIQEVLKTLSG